MPLSLFYFYYPTTFGLGLKEHSRFAIQALELSPSYLSRLMCQFKSLPFWEKLRVFRNFYLLFHFDRRAVAGRFPVIGTIGPVPIGGFLVR